MVKPGCWRCERDLPLVRDPMFLMVPHDRIGVCMPCANARIRVIDRYISNGGNVHFVDDGRGH